MEPQALPTEHLTACPICQHPQSTIVWTQPEAYIREGLCLHRCEGCEQVYLNPRLTMESTTILENQSEVYDYSLEEEKPLICFRGDALQHIEAFAGFEKPGRILDIGCNRGLLLVAARERGWQPVGVELSPVAADVARKRYNLEVYNDDAIIKTLEPFDLITCWHVLEHLHKPVELLRDLASYLKPNGVLALQVPTYQFRDQFIERNQSGSLLCSVHTMYYTAASLSRILAQAGLSVFYSDESPDSLMLTIYASLPQYQVARLEQYQTLYQRPQVNPISEPVVVTIESPEQKTYIATLESALDQKNRHISHLEQQIRALESGKIMRWLKRFQG
ncbi:class I SAM-dependent methyltransferase [Herpetosiphon gulosus]|uniref:Ubiquinone biosynthesis O-methyltransferase, mitochondrial n=1 Tax=Herpetosiphon gulosus TaxID=1973496 RepID=A0ABP9WVF5_9CHLR